MSDSTTRSPSDIVATVKQYLLWVVRVVISSMDRFYVDNGFSRAAALAYTTLLSLVPLMAFAFGLLGAFAATSNDLSDIRKFIFQQFVPKIGESGQVLEYLTLFSEQLSDLNSVVLIVLVVTSLLLISSVESALNEIWQVHEARSITSRIGIFSAILVLAPVLALSAFYFTQFRLEGILDGIGDRQFSMAGAIVISWYQKAIPLIIDIAAFTFLFFLVPKAAVNFRSALIGGVVSGLLFGLAKIGFVVYIEQFSAYAKIYSTLAAVPIFLVWLYLSWVIVLFGSQISYQVQYLPLNGALWQRSLLSTGGGGLLLASQALIALGYAFRDGKPLPNDLELAESLDCSSVVLRQALNGLERNGIIQRANSREMPLVLLKSPATITIEDIQSAVHPRAVGLKILTPKSELLYSRELSVLFKNIADCSQGSSVKPLLLADLLLQQGGPQKS